ncbi:MAG TPA: SAM-dependent methyltransferase [Clostridia bacterium]|nr:SAM-dependent methyltransferase [Clostridia bacterium]
MDKIVEIITSETERWGAIPFARFMELALYCPVYGFYETEGDTIGQRGAFFTSVSAGPLFGELLGFVFADWLEQLPPPSGAVSGTGHWAPINGQRQLVEAAAHDGRLAGDILSWMRAHRPGLFANLDYWIIEPSRRRREWQQRTLRPFAGKVRWFESMSDLQGNASPVCGVIFANELLDAMPVHRFGWDRARQAWFEWGVTFRDGRFVWTHGGPAGGGPGWADLGLVQEEVPPELLPVLPDGFTVEVCPAAEGWWREAARALDTGRLLTFDYGLTSEERIIPERTQGTLRAYAQHQASLDVLANPGGQDITAHVNFSALQFAGESAGLSTEFFGRQPTFLTGIAEGIWARPETFGEWTRAYTRQFQTLTHPDHLGAAFRVLVQGRNSR